MRHGKRSGGGKDRQNRSGGGAQNNNNRRDKGGRDQDRRQPRPQEKARGPATKPAFPGLIESPIRLTSGKPAVSAAETRKLPPRRYGVVFFETLAAAKNDLTRLQDLARSYDQLNIVIRAEASMDDPELAAIGKVFAGAAWALIHDRRVAEGWYNEAH